MHYRTGKSAVQNLLLNSQFYRPVGPQYLHLWLGGRLCSISVLRPPHHDAQRCAVSTILSQEAQMVPRKADITGNGIEFP